MNFTRKRPPLRRGRAEPWSYPIALRPYPAVPGFVPASNLGPQSPGSPYSSRVHFTARQHHSNYHIRITHIFLLSSHLSHPTAAGSHFTAPPPHPTAPQPSLKLLQGPISQLPSLIPKLPSLLYSSMPQGHQSFRRKAI